VRCSWLRAPLAAALSLPETDRARLANQLLDSLVVPDEQADDAWRMEIERRAREVIEGKVELLDYDDVMAELSAIDRE
jgi:putative addiction module component (TIGR02574 family)